MGSSLVGHFENAFKVVSLHDTLALSMRSTKCASLTPDFGPLGADPVPPLMAARSPVLEITILKSHVTDDLDMA